LLLLGVNGIAVWLVAKGAPQVGLLPLLGSTIAISSGAECGYPVDYVPQLLKPFRRWPHQPA
jgi:hypothetical protein